jgi:hypothetical protein
MGSADLKLDQTAVLDGELRRAFRKMLVKRRSGSGQIVTGDEVKRIASERGEVIVTRNVKIVGRKKK